MGQTAVTCAKCGHEVYGRATKRGNHALCPKRKRKRGAKRPAWMLRHEAERNRAYLAGYKDARSRICEDGREILFGIDWTYRVRELELGAQGYCQGKFFVESHNTHYIGNMGDPHHVNRRSKLRDDRIKNLAWICREVHIELDPRQVRWSKTA